MSTVRDDGVPVLERARPKDIIQVLEVDGKGRPKRARWSTAQPAKPGTSITLMAIVRGLGPCMSTIRSMR